MSGLADRPDTTTTDELAAKIARWTVTMKGNEDMGALSLGDIVSEYDGWSDDESLSLDDLRSLSSELVRLRERETQLQDALRETLDALDRLYADERASADTREHAGWAIGATLGLRAVLDETQAEVRRLAGGARHMPGPPDVPGQEKCLTCGGFLGGDAYGHHSRMCRCAERAGVAPRTASS